MVRVRRRRKLTYLQRWRREHPLLQVYLSVEQYKMVKGLADSRKMSIKDLVVDAIQKYEEYDKLVKRINELSKELEGFSSFRNVLLRFIRCVVNRIECSDVCVNRKVQMANVGGYTVSYYIPSVDIKCLSEKFGIVVS